MVEAAKFGSELVALNIRKDLIVALRYKLLMFGVILERSTYVLCDNSGFVNNMSILESVLCRKHN